MYRCFTCEKTFESEESLEEHLEENLYEIAYKKMSDGSFKCKFCGELFADLTDFYIHFYNNKDHVDKARIKLFFGYTEPKAGIKRGGYRNRPIEEELLKRAILKNPIKRKVLYGGRTVNSLLMEEIDYCMGEAKSWVIMNIYGVSGSGKSVAGLTLALHLIKVWLEKHTDYKEDREFWGASPDRKVIPPKLKITQSYSQTLNVLRFCRPGDVVLQDEAPHVSGEGSILELEAVRNIEKVAREYQVSILFVSPVKIKESIIPNLVLEVVGINRETRTTQMVLYDRLQQPLGYVYLEVLPKNDPILLEYEILKTRNIKDLFERGGFVTTNVSEDNLKKDVEMVINKYKEIFPTPTEPIKSDIKGVMTLLKLSYNTETYYDLVASKVKKLLSTEYAMKVGQEMKTPEKKEEAAQPIQDLSAAEVKVSDRPFEEFETPILYENMKETAGFVIQRRIERGQAPYKLFKPKMLDAWIMRYKDNASLSQVSLQFGVDRRVFSLPLAKGGWFAIVQNEILGEIMEKRLADTLLKDYIWKGGSNEPDFISKDGKVMIEVKTMKELDRGKVVLISASEREHLRKGGIVELWQIIPLLGTVKIKKFKVELANENERD